MRRWTSPRLMTRAEGEAMDRDSMSETMRSFLLSPVNPESALNRAVAAVATRSPEQPSDPRQDPRYVKLKGQYRIALAALHAAECVEMEAHRSKCAALKMECELRVSLEILEEDLGITKAEDSA